MSGVPTTQLVQDRRPLFSRGLDASWSVYATNDFVILDIEACPGICDVSCGGGRGCHGGWLGVRLSKSILNSAELEGNAIDDVTSLNSAH